MTPAERPQSPDWLAWHDAYDRPGTPLARRLRVVQAHVRSWAEVRLRDGRGPGQVLSLCAGQGRDVLDVLGPAGLDWPVLLVEADAANVERAQVQAVREGLRRVRVLQADAGQAATWADAPAADLLLLCGVLGNVSDEDAERTVRAVPHLCAPGATAVWTRSRRAPDLTPRVRAWFAAAGFQERAFDAPPDVPWSVGAGVLTGPPAGPRATGTLFTFR